MDCCTWWNALATRGCNLFSRWLDASVIFILQCLLVWKVSPWGILAGGGKRRTASNSIWCMRLEGSFCRWQPTVHPSAGKTGNVLNWGLQERLGEGNETEIKPTEVILIGRSAKSLDCPNEIAHTHTHTSKDHIPQLGSTAGDHRTFWWLLWPGECLHSFSWCSRCTQAILTTITHVLVTSWLDY